ncbi:hypothetical protein TIFTF001_007894 [Ficus carica]|uniref:Uncharacterized protein n=1 Tax=Ficus carica TaxID=3494 RepID=A0AA87ZSE2_FICCA|nr:hypothetical protein TIFTF001_007894 [Ficus carica]
MRSPDSAPGCRQGWLETQESAIAKPFLVFGFGLFFCHQLSSIFTKLPSSAVLPPPSPSSPPLLLRYAEHLRRPAITLTICL